ncbi:MAG: hypothetical protein E7641_04790 [Ruminococcaceae bacterium]|nr:hypothetical protein [Oscillospiraceae bacterium]
MKKALAIILCVVMLLPSFTFLTGAVSKTDITTWEAFAEKYTDFPITQVTATANAPTVDGTISTGEYTTTFPLHEYLVDRRAGATDLPTYVNMYFNEDANYIYVGFTYEYEGASDTLTAGNTDFRLLFSPANENIEPEFTCYNAGSPFQFGLRYVNGAAATWDKTGKGYGSYGASRTDSSISGEFTINKEYLCTLCGYEEDMTAFQFGAWFGTYSSNTERHGYGYAITQEMIDSTPLTRINDTAGTAYAWNDSYLYFKLDSKFPAKNYISYEDVALATLPGGILESEADYPLTTLNPGGNAPKVDGVINASEYQLTQTYTDANITPRSGNYNGGNAAGEVTPKDIKVSMNADSSTIYFGVAVQFDGANTNCSTYTHLDMRFMVEPKQGDKATMCVNAANNATKHQMTLRYDGTKATNGSSTFTGYAGTADANYLYFEFAISKATLLTTYGLDPAKDIDYLLYGWWINTYQDKTMQDAGTAAVRVGYGYNVSANLASYTGWKAQTNSNDWDDTYFTVKMGNGEATRPWFELAQYGIPYASVAPTTKVPSVDGSVAANEYATKMSFTPEANAIVGTSYGALGALEELPNIDVYVTSNQENIYMAVVADKTDLFNGDNINLVATFTDSASIRPIYNVKNPNFNGSGVSGTVGDYWTNYDISSAADNGANDGMGGGGSHYYAYPIVEWDNTDGQDKYVVELVFNKEIIKLSYGLTGDVETMHFGFWLHGIADYDTARICYGVSEAAKSAANTGIGMNVFKLDSGYDLDNAAATLKFMDAGSNNKVDALNLAKYGQLKFYANNPTTAENAIDGVMSEGEYAFDYTFSKMRNVGTVKGSRAQWGVSLGNATLAPAYAKIYMDHDADYFYLALRIKDTNFVPRYCGAGATYSYTTEGDVKTPADVIVGEKAVYDFYKVQIAFNNNGSIVEAAKELELQFYMNADINNDANEDGIAQAEELTPGFHVKSLVGGAAAPLAGMSSAWSCDNSAMKVASNGKWDAENDELVFEVKLSKEEIAKAYGLEALNNTISFRMNHTPWEYVGNVGFDDVAGSDTAIATGGGGGNGLKVYTSYWDGTIWMNSTVNKASFDAVKAELIAKENAESGTYLSGFDYGHVVVLGDEMAAAPVNTVDGASVRFTEGSTGMRFKTLVSKTYYDALIAKYGYSNVTFGTLIAPAEYIEAAGAFTKEALTAANPNALGADYLDVRTNKAYAESDGAYTFLGSIANIKDANLDRDFAAIGYVEYTDGVNTYVVYSDFYTVRSVEEVATMALNDFTTDATGACGYTVANTELVTGKTVYTPYTETQRTIAKKFVA